MTLKRSISITLMTVCAAALFGLGRAEFRSHHAIASSNRASARIKEPDLNLAGTIGPTPGSAIIGHNLHITVPPNTAVSRGDVIGTEEMAASPSDLAQARQELEAAALAERDAAADVLRIEEEQAAVQPPPWSLNGDASIETDELEAKALDAKIRLDDVTTRLRAAKTVVVQMREGVETRPVISPTDGFVVVSGQPGGTSFEIASAGHLYAYAMLPEADLMRVHVGQDASITVDADPAAAFPARVSAVAETPVTSPAGAAYQVTFEVQQTNGIWLTGVAMHARLAPSAQ